MTSKTDICNMGLDLLGNYDGISDIDTPINDQEKVFSLWYDTCRQFVLKLMMPNFALGRDIVAQMDTVPAFGYAYNYQYPSNCLKVFGIGSVKDKANNFAVETDENDEECILVDDNYPTGMPVRFIKDITDANKFTPEFKITLAKYLAAYTCLAITQDAEKAEKLMSQLPALMSLSSGMNAQENPPIRINNSKYKAARRVGLPDYTDKD